ncbi:hypothetical protein ACS0TY_035687 [Phlomoides rotata]
METLRANLVGSLDEEDDLVLEHSVEDEAHQATSFCLVGRFLTDQTINYTAIKNRMLDIWNPVKGVIIRTLGEGRFMFEFYHSLDVARVMNGLPWTFNNHLMLLHHLQRARFGRQIGNFLGTFLEYDKSNDLGAWRNYMRVRVNVDVSLPLKRFKSIRKEGGGSFWITFRYEKLSTFCFVCGRVGHTKSFCEVKYAANGGEVAQGWDITLRALERRVGMGANSRWLRGGPV